MPRAHQPALRQPPPSLGLHLPARARRCGGPIPTPCTVGEALGRHLDLVGAPRRALLKVLAPLAGDAAERAELAALAHKDGKAAYTARVEARCLTLIRRDVARVLDARRVGKVIPLKMVELKSDHGRSADACIHAST